MNYEAEANLFTISVGTKHVCGYEAGLSDDLISFML